MDALIRRFDAEPDGDLMIARARGVAWQADMRVTVRYDDRYFDHYAALEGQPIAQRLNAGRVAMVNRHVGSAAKVIDVGIGSGEFIKSRPNTWGRDVNPRAMAWLRENGLWADSLSPFAAATFWDVLEHVPDPDIYLRQISAGACVFVSLPVFGDLGAVRKSKHYKPGEHLYYWTPDGFVAWMAERRFQLLERSDFETEAGREGIATFAFRRCLPGYHDTLAQYAELHSRAYGTSAWLYFDAIAEQVLALNPKSILDYGCGRSDLAAHFWNDGKRRIARYDPAIPQFKEMPGGPFDLVLCTDVMEHIRLEDVDRVLGEIRGKSQRALFTISLRPARAELPDGRNAHVTLLTAGEWSRWVSDIFGKARRLPTRWDHILMLKTWS